MRLVRQHVLRAILPVLCGVCFLGAGAKGLHASAQASAPSAVTADRVQAQGSSTSSGSDAAAYKKYLKERHDVRQFQRKLERKEELRQSKVDNPEAQDNANVYRHSAMVQSLAHVFGLSTESMARIFESLNFLILMAAVVWFLARSLPKTLRTRRERIQNDIQQARVATEDANRRLADVEQRLARLDDEIQAMQVQTEQETAAEEQRLRAAMQEEKRRIVDAASQEVTVASMSAQRRLKNLAAELVIEHARRRISVSAANDRILVADFLADTATTKRTGGGVN
ncbi:MAG: F0F1 ATP synthase subunit B family protein [Acidobacteriaceae bacterium]